MDEIKVSRIKPALPHPVRCLDVADTLLQNAQTAVPPLSCCFQRKVVRLENVMAGSISRGRAAPRCPASASSLPTSLFLSFSIHQDSLLLTQVRHRTLHTPVHPEGFTSAYTSLKLPSQGTLNTSPPSLILYA